MDQRAGAEERKTVRKVLEAALGSGRPVLEEESARAVLQAYGIPVVADGVEETSNQSASARPLLVAMKRDAVFGPVVAFGLGGVLLEAVHEMAVGLAPLDDRDATGLLGLTKAGGVLGPFRDLPPVDQKGLVRIIKAVGQMALDNPEIVEVSLDPIVTDEGAPITGGFRITVAPSPEEKKRERRAFMPNMAALLAPRSVAVVGASGEMSQWGGSVLRNILDGGYTGKVYAVNPKGGVFFGVQAHLRVEDLPESPDLALLAVAEQYLDSLLRECVRKRVGAVIIMPCAPSDGDSTEQGETEDVAKIATEGALTLIDSGCLGLVSNEVGLHAIGSIKLHPPVGSLSLVSQSGDMGALLAKSCERLGIGVDKFVSVGGEVQIGVAEILDYLRDDPHTSCIAMCLENLRDGVRFVRAAEEVAALKPVAVLHAGLVGQEVGAPMDADASAMAEKVWEAVARKAGLVTCNSPEELVAVAGCLAYLPLPKGRRVAVVGRRRGAGILAMDEVVRCGLTPATLPEEVRADIERLAASWGERNPLDPAATTDGGLTARVIRSVAECEAVDAIILNPVQRMPGDAAENQPAGGYKGTLGSVAWQRSVLELVAELMESTGKPIIPAPNPSGQGSVSDLGKKYKPVILTSARAAALALDRMELYASQQQERGRS